MARHHVILIPGFFAFADFGDLRYFSGVDAVLSRAFADLGLEADITTIRTLPTASIRYRAAKVLEAIAEVGKRHRGPIHLIGHSTGGLDARVAVTPNAALATPVEFDAFHRVASIVTIATPHHGTPLASFFGSAMGQPLLRVLASAAVMGLSRGRLPTATLIRLGAMLARLDDRLGLEHTVLDQVYEQLLGNFTDARRRAFIQFLTEVSNDRALVVQLTPDSLDLFNATTADPSGICYASVITRGRRPEWSRLVKPRHDVYAQGLYAVYSAVWRITSRMQERHLPTLSEQQRGALIAGYGSLPELTDNDGMAPSLGQAWGEIVHVADADHLDVVGQYGDRERSGIHADWLPSGCGFDTQRFTALWRDVAAYIDRSARVQTDRSG